MNNTGLSDNVISIINSVFYKHNEIEKIYVLGSRAKGNYKQNSDIDLAIVGNINSFFAEQIANELEDLPLPYKFDVQAYSQIMNLNLKEHIDRVGIIIYTKTQS